jgi:hypothetical protein
MDVINEACKFLKMQPSLFYSEDQNSVVVEPPSRSGFSVALTVGDGYTVAYDGWHEHFEDPYDALECFQFAYTPQCRLAVALRGHTEYRWTMEYETADGWEVESTVGLLFYPYWRRRRIEYRQNTLLAQ